MTWLILFGIAMWLAWMVRSHARRERPTAALDTPGAPGPTEQDVRLLERLEPGGTPDSAIQIASSSVVESHAAGIPCLRCEGDMVVDEHTVEEHAGDLLRVASVRCMRCGHRRKVYFRLARPN